MNKPTTIAPPPAPITSAADKRRLLEDELIASLVGNYDDTIVEAGWLSASAFSHGPYADLWEAVTTNPPADMAELLQYVAEAGCRNDVARAMASTPSFAYGSYIATELAELTWVDHAGAKFAKLATAAAAGNTRQVTALLAEIQQEQPPTITAPRMRDMADAGDAFLEILRAGNRSISTGIPVLDEATAGLERQAQTILAAPPSTGKSALAFQLARNIAASGRKVQFYSLEMSEASLFARAACGLANVTWQDVRRGVLTPAQMDTVDRHTKRLQDTFRHKLYIHDKPADTGTVWQMVASNQPDVVIVDHIRFLADTFEGERNENKRLGLLSQKLREIAKRFDCHVFVLSQLSRSSKERTDKRPILTDLRDSGELEENADNVWMLYVPVDNTSVITNRNVVDCELWIRKARDGVRDACVNLSFDRRLQWFTERALRTSTRS